MGAMPVLVAAVGLAGERDAVDRAAAKVVVLGVDPGVQDVGVDPGAVGLVGVVAVQLPRPLARADQPPHCVGLRAATVRTCDPTRRRRRRRHRRRRRRRRRGLVLLDGLDHVLELRVQHHVTGLRPWPPTRRVLARLGRVERGV